MATLGVTLLSRVLQKQAKRFANKPAYNFLKEDQISQSLTYEQLDNDACRVGEELRKRGLFQEPVLIMLPQGLAFISVFMGCLYAGAIAVPMYPPRHQRTFERIRTIVKQSESRVIVTDESTKQYMLEHNMFSDLESVTVEEIMDESQPMMDGPLDIGETDIAFLQYTSGSTGQPKGTIISHGNLMANLAYIREAFYLGEETNGVYWLPQFHDMGLVGGTLQCIYSGYTTGVMTPASFLQKPVRWLKAISDYRVFHSGGPNFAFDVSATHIRDEELEGIDLSNWRLAFNGAEPIRVSTMDAFVRRFKPFGFDENALYPCYGLAEATLLVSGSDITTSVKRESFVGKAVIGSGHVRKGFDIGVQVVDPSTLRVCNDGEEGEVWLKGASIAKGYWKNDIKTSEVFNARTIDGDGPYFRTGDLGFFGDNEELFITGREKDMMIVRGRNIYPQDIEEIVERSDSRLMPTTAAVFSMGDGDERIVLAIELDRKAMRHRNAFPELCLSIRKVVSEKAEISLHSIVLLRPGGMLKTSSGKVMRRSCREALKGGRLSLVFHWFEAQSDAFRGISLPDFQLRSNDGKSGISMVEKRVISIWQTFFKNKDIDRESSFFEMGGDSMRAMQILGEINDAFLISVEMDELFNVDTVRELVQLIEQKQQHALVVEEVGA